MTCNKCNQGLNSYFKIKINNIIDNIIKEKIMLNIIGLFIITKKYLCSNYYIILIKTFIKKNNLIK